jgi:hypothetical protein
LSSSLSSSLPPAGAFCRKSAGLFTAAPPMQSHGFGIEMLDSWCATRIQEAVPDANGHGHDRAAASGFGHGRRAPREAAITTSLSPQHFREIAPLSGNRRTRGAPARGAEAYPDEVCPRTPRTASVVSGFLLRQTRRRQVDPSFAGARLLRLCPSRSEATDSSSSGPESSPRPPRRRRRSSAPSPLISAPGAPVKKPTTASSQHRHAHQASHRNA